MSDRVRDLLKQLESGFSETDHRLAIQQLVELWAAKVGPLTSAESRKPQAVLFECSIAIKLRGLGEAPVLVVGEDSPESRLAVTQLITQTGSGRVIGIIVCATDSAFRHLRSTAALPSGRFVVLSRDDVHGVLASDSPLDIFGGYVRNQIPTRRLNPFSVSEPAQGLMFVGRKEALDKLVHDQQDYALCGPGGIGKSSLLRHTKWTLRRNRDPRYERIIEVDLIACPADLDQAARMIATRLYASKKAHDIACADLDAFLRQRQAVDPRFSHGPIDLFIDEIDSILRLDSQTSDGYGNRYPLMRALRHARSANAIRLTISGREWTRQLLEDENNPFRVNSGSAHTQRSRLKLLEVGRLHDNEAHELLFGPLQALGCLDEKRRRACLKSLVECDGVPFHIQNLGLDIVQAEQQIIGPVAEQSTSYRN